MDKWAFSDGAGVTKGVAGGAARREKVDYPSLDMEQKIKRGKNNS